MDQNAFNDMNRHVFSVNYEAGAQGKNVEWVVKGPGTFIRFGAERNEAYVMEARLNNAYILGYASHVIEDAQMP